MNEGEGGGGWGLHTELMMGPTLALPLEVDVCFKRAERWEIHCSGTRRDGFLQVRPGSCCMFRCVFALKTAPVL